jgi:hypothetical protein
MTELPPNENIVRVIQNKLISGEIIDPSRLSNYLLVLSAQYSFLAGHLEDILRIRPACWNKLRESVKSDKACDRLWENTEQGIDEMGYRLQLKSIEKLMSALKTRINVSTTDWHNQKL